MLCSGFHSDFAFLQGLETKFYSHDDDKGSANSINISKLYANVFDVHYKDSIAKGSCVVPFLRVKNDALPVKLKYFKRNELEATDTLTHDQYKQFTHRRQIFHV